MFIKLEKILQEDLKKANIFFETNKVLAEMTSWKIGGPALIVVYPKNVSELAYVVNKVKNFEDYCIIGSGTNLLVKDAGYPYPIIKLNGSFKEMKFNGDMLEAGAAVPLISLASRAAERSLGGLAFASGIPGTLGGAVVMNAGAYGSEIKDLIEEVEVFDTEKESAVKFRNKDLCYSNRNSKLKGNPRYIVTRALLRLYKEDEEKIRSLMKQYRKDRL